MRGVDGVLAIGDCAFTDETPLPATAQVASQQGSYLGRLFSKGFQMTDYSTGQPPYKEVPVEVVQDAADASPGGASAEISQYISRQGQQEEAAAAAAALDREVRFASERIKIGKLGVTRATKLPNEDREVTVELAKPFQFLNLGVLAYIGASEALAQISVDEGIIKGSGGLGFLLWRGIYWFKQVSWRNRVLVALDWAKARIFGRDIGAL